jgi:hypothetical protein
LDNNREARQVFLQQQGFQNWLFAILSSCLRFSENEATVMCELIMRLIAVLYAHALFEKDGYQLFLETEAYLSLYTTGYHELKIHQMLHQMTLDVIFKSTRYLLDHLELQYIFQRNLV